MNNSENRANWQTLTKCQSGLPFILRCTDIINTQGCGFVCRSLEKTQVVIV